MSEQTQPEEEKSDFADFFDESMSDGEVSTAEFATLYESYTKTSVKLDALSNIFWLVVSDDDFDAKLNRIMDLVMESMDVEAGSIYALDEPRGELWFAAARGDKADVIMSSGWRVKLGVGIAGNSALHNETIAVSDVHTDPRFYKEISDALGFETRSMLCVPIVVRGKNAGAIQIINKSGSDQFTGDEIMLLEDIADFTGAVIDAHDKVALSQERVRKLAAVIEFGAHIGTIWELDKLGREMISGITELFEPTALNIMTIDHQSKLLKSFASRGSDGEPLNVEDMALGQGYLGAVALENQPRFIGDLEKENYLAPDIVHLGPAQGSLAALPLVFRNNPVGVLELYRGADRERYFPEDLKIMYQLGKLMAVSLVNVRRKEKGS